MDGYHYQQAALLSGMVAATVKTLERRGFTGAELPGGRWSLQQVIGLRAIKLARQQGATLAAAVAVYDLLRAKSDDELLTEFEAGRSHLLLLGDRLTIRLVTPAAAFDERWRREAVEHSLPWVVLDVRAIREIVVERSKNFQNLPHSETREQSLKIFRERSLKPCEEV